MHIVVSNDTAWFMSDATAHDVLLIIWQMLSYIYFYVNNRESSCDTSVKSKRPIL